MQPRMVMHPMKPEMNGTDISTFKDANGKALFVDLVDVVGGWVGLRSLRMAKAWVRQAAAKAVLCRRLRAMELGHRTGVYIDDLSAQTWASNRALLIAGLVLLITLTVSITSSPAALPGRCGK